MSLFHNDMRNRLGTAEDEPITFTSLSFSILTVENERMSFRSERIGTFGNKRPPTEQRIERLLPPSLKSEEDEESEKLEMPSSGKRTRPPKHIEKPRKAD